MKELDELDDLSPLKMLSPEQIKAQTSSDVYQTIDEPSNILQPTLTPIYTEAQKELEDVKKFIAEPEAIINRGKVEVDQYFLNRVQATIPLGWKVVEYEVRGAPQSTNWAASKTEFWVKLKGINKENVTVFTEVVLNYRKMKRDLRNEHYNSGIND